MILPVPLFDHLVALVLAHEKDKGAHNPALIVLTHIADPGPDILLEHFRFRIAIGPLGGIAMLCHKDTGIGIEPEHPLEILRTAFAYFHSDSLDSVFLSS